MSFFLSDVKEVVRLSVKVCNGVAQPEYKKLCIDPQNSSFDMLYSLISKAFNIQSSFTIFYLTSDGYDEDTYLSLLTDWDLDAAISDSSSPILRLKVDVKQFDEEVIDGWDIVSPLPPAQNQEIPLSRLSSVQNTLRETLNKVSLAGKNIRLKTLHHLSFDESSGIFVNRSSQSHSSGPTGPPLSDSEFHRYMDKEGRLKEPAHFRLAVYARGVESSLRSIVWRHLLNVFPPSMTGNDRYEHFKEKCTEYLRLRDAWQARAAEGASCAREERSGIHRVMSAVKKDVLRTDRRYPFFSGSDDSANIISLYNIVVTYAVTHPAVSYCQGMSDLAAPLLVVEKHEPSAYITFVALMRRLHPQFTGNAAPLGSRLTDLALLVRHHDPMFHAFLVSKGAEDLFFTYRWLLIEMKREFPLDDAMCMLEVMWSTLPICPPPGVGGLSLVDTPDWLDHFNMTSNPNAAYVSLKGIRRRMTSQLSNNPTSPVEGVLSQRTVPASESQEKSMTARDVVNKSDVLSTVDSIGHESVDILNQDAPTESTISSAESTVEGLNPHHLEHNVSITNESIVPGLTSNAGSAHISRTEDYSQVIDKDETDISNSIEHTVSDYDIDGALLDDSIDFVVVSQAERPPRLPSPDCLGGGNPFLMFLCLVTLLEQRDVVMSKEMDYNDMAVHYDRMARRHDVKRVLSKARVLYSEYLKQQMTAVRDECMEKKTDLNV